MEDAQMKTYGFFKKIGAFSVNPDNPRSAIRSLRYAVESMNRPRSSLFIYPEGEIVPFSTKEPEFKKGLGWIASQCPDADVVPIGIYIHTAASDRPELFLKIGSKLVPDSSKDLQRLNSFFESELSELLKKLVETAHYEKSTFRKI